MELLPNRKTRRAARAIKAKDGGMPRAAAPTTIVIFAEVPVHDAGEMLIVDAATIDQAEAKVADREMARTMVSPTDIVGLPIRMADHPVYTDRSGKMFIASVCRGADDIIEMAQVLGFDDFGHFLRAAGMSLQ